MLGSESAKSYNWLELSDGTRRVMTSEEKKNPSLIPQGARAYNPDNLTSQSNPVYEFEYKGKKYANLSELMCDKLSKNDC